jgi:ubiquitin C-terminal hydrolase
MNAALQCMIHNPQLLLEATNSNTIIKRESCSEELFRLIKVFAENKLNNAAAKPSELKLYVGMKYPQFSGYNQEDSIEFVHQLLELLNVEFNRVTKKIPYKLLEQTSEPISIQADNWYGYNEARSNSIITDIFQGQLFNTVKCCVCGHEHISFDNFLSLSLTLPKDAKQIMNHLELEKCLQDYVKEEQIPSSHGYRCEICKKTVDITKQTVIWRLPSVLIIHLKRFQCIGRRKEKLITMVEFPLTNFDLKSFCGESGSL